MKKLLILTVILLLALSLFSCNTQKDVDVISDSSENLTDRSDMEFSDAEFAILEASDKIFTETYGFKDLSLFYVNISEWKDQNRYTVSYHLTFNGIRTDEYYCIELDKNKDMIKTDAYGKGEFSKYIGDKTFMNALSAAKKSIEIQTASNNKPNHFYFTEQDGYLCPEIIVDIDSPEYQTDENGYSYGGCGIDHEHIFFSEKICPLT
ncbi:MAG: hypothetical protein IJY39_00460 [Clostridia bacterium]|nr:hypothetical protein [Clostridia bacterium]